MKFCQQAQEMSSVVDGNQQHDDYFSISHKGFIGIVWKQNLFDVTPQALSSINCSCKGFNLVILDLLCSDKVCSNSLCFITMYLTLFVFVRSLKMPNSVLS